METKEETFLQKTYTVKEIAFREGVSTDTVYRWCRNGFVIYERRPTYKGKGSIIITEQMYLDFKSMFSQKP